MNDIRISLCPSQVCRRIGYHQKQAQRCSAYYGRGYHRIQRGLPSGPNDQPEHPILSGPLLHEPHLYSHAHQPAQWVTFTFPWIVGMQPTQLEISRYVFFCTFTHIWTWYEKLLQDFWIRLHISLNLVWSNVLYFHPRLCYILILLTSRGKKISLYPEIILCLKLYCQINYGFSCGMFLFA